MEIPTQLPTLSSLQLRKQQTVKAPTPDVAKEMESLFVSLMLKEMRQAGSEGGLFPGDSSDTFGGMFDLYLGNYIAEAGGIGLGDSIQSDQLQASVISRTVNGL